MLTGKEIINGKSTDFIVSGRRKEVNRVLHCLNFNCFVDDIDQSEHPLLDFGSGSTRLLYGRGAVAGSARNLIMESVICAMCDLYIR